AVSGFNARLRRGGIFHNILVDGSFPFFGGGNFNSTDAASFDITTGTDDENVYDQRLPEAGFPVYAAGTDYLAISKQIN
ncbi:hypothetical protein IAI36_11740, partial [Streptococcus pseudopneumoniae]|uniref:hypothetical protein n=1 Tax=Streptococcus pseudopneumoniae TaxID=257758 RepID=UPI0018B0180C